LLTWLVEVGLLVRLGEGWSLVRRTEPSGPRREAQSQGNAARASALPPALLGLQRAAGNAAVSRYLQRGRSTGPAGGPPVTVQRALGFELEMLALVDDNGEPAAEKKPFGTYRNLTLDVDHSSEVETPTPNSVAQGQAPGNDADQPARNYDSIVELVTEAYPPENLAQAATLLDDIRDAQAFASSLTLGNRVPATSIPGITANARTARYYVGNPALGKQTTDASWQATLGIRLSQIGPLFDRLIGQGRFVNKHQSDVAMPGHIAKEGMAAARRDAASTVSVQDFQAFVDGEVGKHYYGMTTEKLIDDLGGFLTLVSEYIRMGQEYGPSGTPKNIVSVLSRTDLSEVMKRLKDNYPHIYDKGTRAAIIDMLTDVTNGGISGAAALRGVDNTSITVRTFLENIFYELNDGVTNTFIGFRRLPHEVVNETTGEEGPVVEVRNIAKPAGVDAIATDRFRSNEWVDLAQFFITTVAELNTSNQTNLYQEAAVNARHPAPVVAQPVAPQGNYVHPTGNSLSELLANFAATGQLRAGTQTVVRALPSIYGDQ
jgi:hypothetical protein